MKTTQERGGDVPEKDPNIRLEGDNSFIGKTWGSVKTAVLGSFAAMLCGLAILVVSIMAAANPMSVFPHGADQTDVIKVEYYLPYPGLLPDSPLYKLKAARDKISLWLILDGEKKAMKELLYADKRINASVFLIDGGKEDLGVTTVTKAEKYLESAINRAIALSGQGKDVKSLLGILETASYKHLEILKDISDKATGERKRVVDETLGVTQVAHEKVEQAVLEAK